MPANSNAAATVSPVRALTALPSTVIATGAPASASLLNMKPPRTEGSDQRLVERAAGDHRRNRERVIGRKRHAGMTADSEGAGMSLGLVIDREPVLGHDANGAPGAHHVHVGKQRELAHRALRLGRADA